MPDDEGSWANLGLAYVEQARVTGNPTFYVQAEKAIDRSLEVLSYDNARGVLRWAPKWCGRW